ncbi:MAG: hypothetical protein MUF72_05140 [Elainella sp. Prado103]|jgi:hypothetical protein|nr:hypothetical protein [Elainella sp. Prado103]
MVDPIDDIARQARQGSVSAIIQTLNDKLADSGVRTRAMFDQGVLQLLCEAPTPEQLEQPILVPQVKQILEALQPRNVRRVNINSRIVREQQLLWLEEIKRDPNNQLLWSEEITLDRSNFFQRLLQDRQDHKLDPSRTNLPKASPRVLREKKVFWRGLLGGASLSLFLLLLGWAVYSWLTPRVGQNPQANQAADPRSSAAPATTTPASNSPGSNPAESAPDPFAQAVRLAEETVVAGQAAQTSAEWLEVASRWQRASDLMAQIDAADARYAVAQDRVQLYRQNSEAALEQAQKAQ